MHRHVIGRGRESDHFEAPRFRFDEAMRDERGRDSAPAVSRRDATALQPGLARREDREPPHPDDPAMRLGDEERAAAVRHPFVEEAGNAVVPAPDRAHGVANALFVAWLRAPDDQVHPVILPQRC